MKKEEMKTGKSEVFENFATCELNPTELLTLRGGDGDPPTDPDPQPIIVPIIG